MINPWHRAAGALLLAAATVATGVTPAAAAPAENVPAAPTTTASIKGWARMYFPAPGNDVQVTVDAHGEYSAQSPAFPTRAWGSLRIYHAVEEPGKPQLVNWGELEVDCLTTGGPTATVTGILVRASPGGPWEDLVKRKVRMGVSFYVAGKGKGKGPSRIGLSGATAPGQPPLTKCMAPAADAPLTRGGYVLKDKGPLS